jgi:DNA repair protein RecN (Recombination protein N)
LTASGRSRVFVNDTPVGVTQLKEIGAKLIDIHSQHQNLLIADKNYQLSVLDTLADDKLLLDRYSKEYNAYLSLVREIERMKEELEKSRRDEEWLRFQMNELESAFLKDGELEELEQEVQELSHSEEIQAALYGACNAIDSDERGSLLTALRDASSALSRIASHYGAAEELSERLESNYIELKDCCSEMMQRAERVQFAPDRLEFVERRIALIYDLQKKHRVATVGELIALYNDISARLERISCGDDDIKDAEKQLSALRAGMADIAGELTEKRRQSAERLKNDITAILVNLGMPMIRFEVDMKRTSDFTSNGVDSVNFLFSANSSSAPQPLCDVASGGEMSRVMLALKSLIASQRNQPTLIFDEVDTGVSGVIAERMGRLMQQMGGANRQVLSITHLPQVAALGVNHYKVYKEETEKGTVTNMIKLDQQERVREIAQMMSGEQLTDAAVENASLLLSQSK